MRKFMFLVCLAGFLFMPFHNISVNAQIEPQAQKPGDYNHNGVIDENDAEILQSIIDENLEYDSRYDLYQDGVIDQNDFNAIRFYLIGWTHSLPFVPFVRDVGYPPPLIYGDCDGTGTVDEGDLFCISWIIENQLGYSTWDDLLPDNQMTLHDLIVLHEYIIGLRESLPVQGEIDFPPCVFVWPYGDCTPVP